MSGRNVPTDMPVLRTSRRRFIAVAAAAAGMALLPRAVQAERLLHRWNGVALGARASIQLTHPDAAEARRIIGLAVQEIERLEAMFSLYRVDSALMRLNRDGQLVAPPLEMVDLLQRAAGVSAASGGRFDITVQPLWQRYSDHFAADPGAAEPPRLDDILPLVDWRAVRNDPAAIGFDRPGMAATLNGIAQGYITDRVAELLRRNDVARVLLNLGEARALGHRPDGAAWRIGIADPADPMRVAGRLDCADLAVATSGGYGTVLDAGRRFTHLLDPRRGATAAAARSITVVAREACHADAWSTACALMEDAEIRRLAGRIGVAAIYASVPGAGLRRLA